MPTQKRNVKPVQALVSPALDAKLRVMAKDRAQSLSQVATKLILIGLSAVESGDAEIL